MREIAAPPVVCACSLDRDGLQASSDPRVQRLRRDVGAIRPHDRPQLLVELRLAEIVGVGKRLEDAAPAPARKIDFTLGAILEPLA